MRAHRNHSRYFLEIGDYMTRSWESASLRQLEARNFVRDRRLFKINCWQNTPASLTVLYQEVFSKCFDIANESLVFSLRRAFDCSFKMAKYCGWFQSKKQSARLIFLLKISQLGKQLPVNVVDEEWTLNLLCWHQLVSWLLLLPTMEISVLTRNLKLQVGWSSWKDVELLSWFS